MKGKPHEVAAVRILTGITEARFLEWANIYCASFHFNHDDYANFCAAYVRGIQTTGPYYAAEAGALRLSSFIVVPVWCIYRDPRTQNLMTIIEARDTDYDGILMPLGGPSGYARIWAEVHGWPANDVEEATEKA